MMRLIKEMRRLENQESIVLTTPAIDFAGIWGEGRQLERTSPYWDAVHTYPILRLPGVSFEKTQNLLQLTEYQNLFQRAKELGLEKSTIDFFVRQGPLIEGFFDKNYGVLAKKIAGRFSLTLQDVNFSHCTYLPYANVLYNLILSSELKIPTFITPFLHSQNPRYDLEACVDVLSKYTGIFCCTEEEKRFLQKQGLSAEKLFVLPMGVDFDKFQAPKKDKFQDLYGKLSPYVLFCGHKNFEKGAITLLHALRELYREGHNLGAVFIGASSYSFDIEYGKLRKECPDMTLLNFTPQNLSGYFDWKKIAAFNEALCYAMVSRSDAYGIAYLEAWACGIPVIAADIPAMHEVVSPNKDGFLVPFDDPHALASKLLHYLQNPEDARVMGARGREKVRKRHQWYKIAEKTFEIVKALI